MLCSAILHARSAVTYTFSGGRFGDNVLSYCRAKWISYVYDIPLLYVPFEYSDQLMMHRLEIHLSQDLINQFEKVVFYKEVNGHIDPNSNILYVINFFPESKCERNCTRFPYLFDVDWNNRYFKKLLQRMIAPTAQLPSMVLPKDQITVAVHARLGTGFDIYPGQTFVDLVKRAPIKCPPHSFYIKSIKKLATEFPDKKIYVYIFTDHDNPYEVMQAYEKLIDDQRITFACRLEENKHYLNVIEDFFGFTQFDCLIRPDSNFSIVASKIADYKVLIVPGSMTEINGEIIIDPVIEEKK